MRYRDTLHQIHRLEFHQKYRGADARLPAVVPAIFLPEHRLVAVGILYS